MRLGAAEASATSLFPPAAALCCSASGGSSGGSSLETLSLSPYQESSLSDDAVLAIASYAPQLLPTAAVALPSPLCGRS